MIKIGLVGTGTVGAGCIDIIRTHSANFRKMYGFDMEITRVCSMDIAEARAKGMQDIFTSDFNDIINDSEIDIVIELIGGIGAAYALVKKALTAGKHVVTANKALMAAHGEELERLAEKSDVNIAYEASVGGGIPILGPLKHSLCANEITTVMGIVNGTTNYILTKMSEENMDYQDALKLAQNSGFAEADPTADVDGHDAAAKIAILATLAFKQRVTIDDVYTEGIRHITPMDLKISKDMGYTIKLVAHAHRTDKGIDVRVHPTMLPINHQLSKVDGVFNAIYVIGDFVGEAMFFGEGAGAGPAASAVMGDVVEVCRRINTQACIIPDANISSDTTVFAPIEELENSFYIRFHAADKPGVLAKMAGAFARNDVSVHSVIQRGESSANSVTLTYITHHASEKAIRAALSEIVSEEGVLTDAPFAIRVQD